MTTVYKLLLIFLLLIVTGDCRNKKTSDIKPYRATAQSAIDGLRTLEESHPTKTNLEKYQQQLQAVGGPTQQFLQQSEKETARASRQAINDAWQDFQLVAELLQYRQKKRNKFAAERLFSDIDAEMFQRVQARYKLGQAIALADRGYYFFDAVVHEAWRTANRQLDRAGYRLQEEIKEEDKAAREARQREKDKRKLAADDDPDREGLQETSPGKESSAIDRANAAKDAASEKAAESQDDDPADQSSAEKTAPKNPKTGSAKKSAGNENRTPAGAR
jgi:hypothetical protein